MGLTVKSLQIGEQSRTKFKIHKGYGVTRANSASLGVETYLAEYQTGSMISWTTGSSDPTTTKGLYRNQVHHSINTMFYRNYTNHPGETIQPGGSHPQNQDRILDRKSTVISISQERYGELIAPGTFQIVGKDGVTIVDDKQGNLIDGGLATTYMIPSASELFRLSFNECHEFTGLMDNSEGRYRKEYQLKISGSRRDYITEFQLDDTSVVRQRAYAYNMRFEERDGSFGTHAVFTGLGGTTNPVNGQNPYRGGAGNIIVSNRHDGWDKFKFANGDDFAVAFWINIPPSQSVTQSYYGFEGEQSNVAPEATNASTTFDHETNVLIARQGMTQYRRSPFMIETYNQRRGDVDTDDSGDVGKLVLKRGKSNQCEHDSTPQLTSSAQLNDGQWHHIVYQYQTGSNEFWVDGIKQTSASDGAQGHCRQKVPTVIGGALQGYVTASSKEKNDPLQRNGPTYSTKWHWSKQGGFGNSSPKNIVQPFSGSMDEVRIFNKCLTHNEIAFLSESNNTNEVGNMFYRHGFACITHPNAKYQDVMNDLNAEIAFNGSTQLTELEYTLNVKSHEFDASENITLRRNEDPDEIDMKDFATGSSFSPYISTLGLYNNQLELLAIAKLAQPLKKPQGSDLTFIVRMDKL
jgi:hypothetical protein